MVRRAVILFAVMWTTLSVIAAAALIVFWRGLNAVWVAAAAGLIGGLIVGAVYYFVDNEFDWSKVGKSTVVAVLIGAVIEVPWRIMRHHPKQ